MQRTFCFRKCDNCYQRNEKHFRLVQTFDFLFIASLSGVDLGLLGKSENDQLTTESRNSGDDHKNELEQ